MTENATPANVGSNDGLGPGSEALRWRPGAWVEPLPAGRWSEYVLARRP